MDDDTRNMNLSQDSQERNDDEGERGPDVTEEEAVIANSCIQTLKELVTKADTEIDELEKDLVFLQIELASAGREHWLNEFYNALRDHVDWLEMELVGLRNNIMSPNEAETKKLHVMLNALMARLVSLAPEWLLTSFITPHVTPPSALSIHQYPEGRQLLVTMDDDIRNMNLNQDSQERNDDEGERRPDVTEEEAVIANSCIQALKELVTKADTEIDELEKDLVFLQIELASAGREHWLNEFYNALRDHVDWQEMALVGLRNNIVSPNEAEPKKLHVMLNALMARLVSLAPEWLLTSFITPHVTPPSALSIHQYPEARQLLVTLDDDTRNMNLNQNSQERNDDEGECGPVIDVTEEEAVTEKSCIQALKELVTKADTEIDELEKDLVFLQIELASTGCEHWLYEFYKALRNHIDWLEMALVGLRNNIMSPNEARRRLYREPAKKLHVILNALMASFSGSGMATDEFDNPLVTPPSAPSAHQYPEMIMAAIEALNEPNGSNKTTIFKHLESTYGKLPAAHNKLLSDHLTGLKNSGQLVYYRNNYMKPDRNTPPQGGRGRPPKPPKPKNPLSSAAAVSYASPRTRSRTSNARDPLAPVSQPKKVSAGSGWPHGRPRKDKAEGTSSPPAGEPEISREQKIPTGRRTWRPLRDFYKF